MSQQKDSFSALPGMIEAGGSVFELIEFSLKRKLKDGRELVGRYGVNVAKVREVLRMPRINPLASRIASVAGIFELRGTPIPVINLARALGDEGAPVTPDQQVIVTEFSKKRAGFVVSSTHRIRRVAWDKVMPPTGESEACITGMTLIEDNEFLFILDLERILIDIEGGNSQRPNVVPMMQPVQIAAPHAHGQSQAAPAGTHGTILLVDDSRLIIATVKSALQGAGFRVIEATDGAQALGIIESTIGTRDKVDVIVSDVEMPRMDGLTLTKKVRENPKLQTTPIILHTSLSGQANQEAGLKVGANGYVVKNNVRDLLELIHELIGQGGAVKLGA